MYQEMLELTKRLVQIPSVNSTPGEASIGIFIESYIREIPYFQEHPELLMIQKLSNDNLNRQNVFALLLGENEKRSDTLIFHGHTDTVGTEDFGELKEVAFSPDILKSRLEKMILEKDVKNDLESGDYLFGRGACDMKSGVAVFLVLLKEYAGQIKKLSGNILVSFNPVEENSHTGIIEAIQIFQELKIRYDLTYRLAINNDYICPLYQGDPNRYVYLGVGGKLLPCFYIQGKETHVGQCFEGFDATLAAAKLVDAINYQAEFCDGYKGEYSMPPTVLKMQDLKEWYNVQTADSSFVYFNYFVHHASIEEIMKKLAHVCKNVMEDTLATMNERYEKYCRLSGNTFEPMKYELHIMMYDELLQIALQKIPQIKDELDNKTNVWMKEGEDKRSIAMKLVRFLLQKIGLKEPVIVLFFAAPYCPHNTLTERDAQISNSLKEIVKQMEEQYDTSYEMLQFFPSLSDSSYLRIADSPDSLQHLIQNFPQQSQLYPLPIEEMLKLDIPAVNYGCYGKDAHKWTERVQISYSFKILPELIKKTVEKYLM